MNESQAIQQEGREIEIPEKTRRSKRKSPQGESVIGKKAENACNMTLPTTIASQLGKKQGKLTVLAYDGKRNGMHFWKCLCECGRVENKRDQSLKRGAGQCVICRNGMNSTRHGSARKGRKTKEYRSWRHMRERCLNPNNKNFDLYGGRGITICDQWNSFPAFLSDMGECPVGLTLDRIDSNGNYEPNNCRWVTQSVQCNNQRRNRIITYNDKRLTLADFAKATGIRYGYVRKRFVVRSENAEQIVSRWTQLQKDRQC